MKKAYLPLTALVAGLGLAFLAAGVSSLFFVLLPVTAFIFGYFSTWRRGLLCGLLLFASYTLALSFIWWGLGSPNLLYPVPGIAAFIAGGFSLLFIGSLAPLSRKGVKRPGSFTALVILAVFTGWAGYTALPHYSYYYQIAIQSLQDVSNLELYLPVGTVSGEPNTDLYNQELKMPGDLTSDFTREVVNTEQGKMLKITIPALKKDSVPVPRYSANIIFCQGRAFWQKIIPFQLIQLMPKSEAMRVDTITSQRFVGPVKTRESRITERFKVPVKVTASTSAQIRLSLWNRTDRSQALNFTYIYNRSEPYTEQIINNDLLTDGQWSFVPVEASSLMEIRGMSD